LYLHYLRTLAVHKPSVFVFENVKGLLSSRLESEPTFARILADLQNPSFALAKGNGHLSGVKQTKYKIRSFVVPRREAEPLDAAEYVIKAEQFGVPQARHRVIVLGIRSDLEVEPQQLEARRGRVPLARFLRDLPRLRSMLSREPDSHENWVWALEEGFATGAFTGVDRATRRNIRKAINRAQRYREVGEGFVAIEGADIRSSGDLAEWLVDKRIRGICNHEARSHRRDDLYRYMFASCFAQVKGRSPLLEDFPAELLPAHRNVAKAIRGSGHFSDRFRVQLAGRPSTTVTSHIAKDGHYFIHYDPAQCRSLSVREAARLQTFPDNYFFEGNQTEQYTQVGNAVPPFLALQLARVVRTLLDQAAEERGRGRISAQSEESRV